MDDDIFPNLSVINAKKTYMKKSKKDSQSSASPDSIKISEDDKIEPLTTKVAIKLLLEGKLKSKVCRYCLNISPGLTELDQILQIAGSGNMYKVTIRDIVASFHPFKVVDDPNFPNKICQKCVDRALSAYRFTQQCERAERAMLNCFDDMYEKLEKLDPIDRPKKRGRQKQNPNFNILHAEHYKVIDYAEPIINIINIESETPTNEPELNDLECKKCWQVLPNMESLLNHEKIHPKTMWYHCRLCGKSFPKRNQLKKHNRRVHVLGKEVQQFNKDFKCNECNHLTENYIEHLRHVEKHRFRNIMEHLIEKRADQLCTVCLHSGTKMMSLDQMVCLHGGHPDLMGDKTLYTLLASTLPDKKSYKYQELFVPTQTQIMTISKKSRDQSFKDVNNIFLNENTKENIVFSNPVVVSKKRVKTDHFYYYVFCDPQYHSDIDKCDTIEIFTSEVEDLSLVTQTVDIVEIDNNGNERVKIPTENVNNYNLYDKPCASTSVVADYIEKYSINQEPVKKKHKASVKKGKKSKNYFFDENYNNEKDYATKIIEFFDNENEPSTKKAKMESEMQGKCEYKAKEKIRKKPTTVENISDCYPEIKGNIDEFTIKAYDQESGNVTDIIYTNIDESKHTEKANAQSELITMLEEGKTARVKDTKRLTRNVCDKCWLIKDPSGACNCRLYDNSIKVATNEANETADCQFCWIFKHTDFCGYCKKPFLRDVNKGKDTKVNINENKRNRDLKDKEVWQCNVCLTNNNSDRITCHCCEATRKTDNSDIRLAFDNKTFFQTKDTKDAKEESRIVDENVPNESNMGTEIPAETDTSESLDESSMMETCSEVNDNPTIVNINMQTMDIESDSSLTENDIEEMDVEENPITMSKGLDWNQVFKLNIDANVGDTIASNIGTNVKFSIGCTNVRKRKFKRVVRSVPKAFHK